MDLIREFTYPTPLLMTPYFIPLMLYSLSRQKNSPSNTQTVSTIFSEYDYVIVGAGSGGATVAGRLSEESCKTVLLLEAGGKPPILNDVPAYARSFWFTDLDWQYKTVPQTHTGRILENQQVVWPSGKGLGGSSLLNAMLYVRGNRKNYDDWAAQGATGWSYNDVFKYFLKLEDERNETFLANGYHSKGGPITVENPAYEDKVKENIYQAAEDYGYDILDSNAARQTGFYDFQTNTRDHQRVSTAKGYLVPAEGRKNLHILPHAFVTKVIIENKKAVGVVFEVDNTSYQIKVRQEVIMSAGTINSAKLLMLSGIGPKEELDKHGIPLIADLPVGKNLQDHFSVPLTYLLGPSIAPAISKVTNFWTILNYIFHRKGILTTPELVQSLAFLNGTSIRPQIDDPNIELYFGEASSNIDRKSFGISKTAYEKMKMAEGKPAFLCFASVIRPLSIGSVTLNSSDPHDPPLIDPNYMSNPEDLENAILGIKDCNRIALSKGMQQIGSKPPSVSVPGCEQLLDSEDDYARCIAQSLVVTMSHQVGTAKMGDPTDPSTVVDPELKVKGIDGLRVVDASIMPIVPSGNTNIPTIMVAEKGSDIIKQSIRCN